METPQPVAASLKAAHRAGAVGRAALRWMRSRDEWRWLIALCAAVRLLAMLSSPAILNDSVSLLRSATRVSTEGPGVLLQIPHHPLPVAVFALAGRWFDPLTAASVLCALGSSIAVWPLHALARRACGRHAALAACLFYAVLPKAVAVGAVPLAEGIALPFFLGALALAAAARDAPRAVTIRRLVGAGALAGLAFLCRPEALIAFPAALAAAALDGRVGKLRRAGLVTLGFVVFALPYVVLLSQERGRLTLSPKKDLARFVGAAAPLRDAVPSGAAIAAPEQPSDAHTGGVTDIVRGTASALESALTVPLIVLVLLGTVPYRRWRRRRARRPRLLLIATALILIALVARLHAGWGYGGGRHVLAAAVLLLPFAGEGLALLGSIFVRVTTRRRFLIVAATTLAIPLGATAVLRPPGEGGLGARRLGEALAAAIEREGGASSRVTIASSGEPRVAFYADRVLDRSGGSARDLPLWGRFLRPLSRGAALDDVVSGVHAELALSGADWLVLDVVDRDAAEVALLRALRERGLVSESTIAAGSELAAIAVVR